MDHEECAQRWTDFGLDAKCLEQMERDILHASSQKYPGLEEDQIKLYVHYQPTYYHFHLHVVHVALEAGATQATGKAIGLRNIISEEWRVGFFLPS